jgi:hypothetical protein
VLQGAFLMAHDGYHWVGMAKPQVPSRRGPTSL